MLQLMRRPYQRIIVEHAGETLVIEVHDLRPNRVTVGIDAPQSFAIRRAELKPEDKPCSP